MKTSDFWYDLPKELIAQGKSGKEIKDILKAQTDAFKVMMSGSGPTVYAVYKTRKAAQEAYQKVKGLSDEVYMTHTTTH